MKKLLLILTMCITTNAFAQNSFPTSNVIVVEDSITHIITATVIGNGVIAPWGFITVHHGDTQSFFIQAAMNSKIMYLWVDGIDVLPAYMGYYTYTFDNITADHTIVAEFGNVGINENEHSNLFIYPNPTSGELRIENGELRIENIEIYDIYGRKLYLSTRPLVHSSTVNIDISHLQSGIYFLKIDNQTFKIIKN